MTIFEKMLDSVCANYHWSKLAEGCSDEKISLKSYQDSRRKLVEYVSGLEELKQQMGDEVYCKELGGWVRWKMIDGDLLAGESNLVLLSFRNKEPSE